MAKSVKFTTSWTNLQIVCKIHVWTCNCASLLLLLPKISLALQWKDSRLLFRLWFSSVSVGRGSSSAPIKQGRPPGPGRGHKSLKTAATAVASILTPNTAPAACGLVHNQGTPSVPTPAQPKLEGSAPLSKPVASEAQEPGQSATGEVSLLQEIRKKIAELKGLCSFLKPSTPRKWPCTQFLPHQKHRMYQENS